MLEAVFAAIGAVGYWTFDRYARPIIKKRLSNKKRSKSAKKTAAAKKAAASSLSLPSKKE